MKIFILFFICFSINAAVFDCYITNPAPSTLIGEINEYKVSNKSYVECQQWFNENNIDGSFRCEGPCEMGSEDKTSHYEKIAELQQLKKDRNFGQVLYDKIVLRNKEKNLTVNQRKQIRTSFDEIRKDLQDGDICVARNNISAITPNAIVTSDDISYVLQLISEYKECP